MSDLNSSFLPEEYVQFFRKNDPSGKGVFPPKVAAMVPFEFIEYKKGEFIKCRFSISDKYDNPMGATFGGIYGMFFDSVFGSFSSLETSGITSSLDMNITYIKSVSVKDKYVDVTASVNACSKSFFLVRGEMHTKEGVLVATATSRMMIMDVKRIKSLKI